MSRFAEVKSKYPKLNIEIIAKKDPSNNFKYLNWMCREIDKGTKRADVYGTISGYHIYINALKQDINKLSCKELEDKVKEHLFSLKEKNLDLVEGFDYRKRFEDDNFLIIDIFTKEAAIKYGKGTKWCISSVNNDYFEEYSNDKIFFLINKKDESPSSKLAMVIPDLVYGKTKMFINDHDFYEEENVTIFNSEDKMVNGLGLAVNYSSFISYIKYILPQSNQEEKQDRLIKKSISFLYGESYTNPSYIFNFILKNLDFFKKKITIDTLNNICNYPKLFNKEGFVTLISEKYKFDRELISLNNFILNNFNIKNNPIKDKKEFDKFLSFFKNKKELNKFLLQKEKPIKELNLKQQLDRFIENEISPQELKKIIIENKNKTINNKAKGKTK